MNQIENYLPSFRWLWEYTDNTIDRIVKKHRHIIPHLKKYLIRKISHF